MYQSRLWTLEEQRILRTYYKKITMKELQQKLYEVKGDQIRNFDSIMAKANKMNLSKNE